MRVEVICKAGKTLGCFQVVVAGKPSGMALQRATLFQGGACWPSLTSAGHACGRWNTPGREFGR
jgi:hypothetical protein